MKRSSCLRILDSDSKMFKDLGHELANQRPGFVTKSSKLNLPLDTSVTMDVDVDNDLQCPICLELYTFPIILPCSHVLCRKPCAEHLFDFNFIRCPVCRDNCYVSGGINSLPRVIALENIIERYKSERKKEPLSSQSSVSSNTGYETSIPSLSGINTKQTELDVSVKCQNCKSATPRRAKKLCLTCGTNFCGACLRHTHPNREPYTSHEFTNPEPFTRPNTTKPSSQSSTSLPSSVLKTDLGRNKINSYCNACRQPFCSNGKDAEIHEGHPVTSVEEAHRELKYCIEDSSDKLSTTQAKVVACLKDQKDGLKDLQHVLIRRRDEINMQCDALLAEIENKRSFFLADLEYEERVHQNSFEDSIKTLEKLLGSSQGLQNYVRDVLQFDRTPFLEVAGTLNERIVKASLDCDDCDTSLPLISDALQNKVVDCRREKLFLREMHYLSPPSTPIVDVTRCSRSEDAVVLALCPPKSVHDLVDQYKVHFCSEEQKNIELEETLVVKNSIEDSTSIKLCANTTGILVILLENLCRSTTYYFCLTASNTAGKSASSEVVQCTTLGQGENVIPAPEIVDSLCKCFTSSIQIFSSSPMDVASEQKISHFLLYRQPSQNRVWKCISMYGRQEHRVFGLEPSTEYDFVILAYNLRGECQLSNKVTFHTESSAGY